MVFHRSSGILLHITSLPGQYGIGEIGPHAYTFIDRLKTMGQHLWQILPIGPTGLSASPYQSLSSFAGNPLLISFELLIKNGYLKTSEVQTLNTLSEIHIDSNSVFSLRSSILNIVAENFQSRASKEFIENFREFCSTNSVWLDDFALFITLKELHNNQAWADWKWEYKHRNPDALSEIAEKYKSDILKVKILQFLFHDQWHSLIDYAHKRNVRIIGDIPIYVAYDSVDVWANQSLFHLDCDGKMDRLSGAPPCYFSETGQLWGNPIYNWDVHKKTRYKWWVSQIKKLFTMVDIVRIDHFNGFVKYWEVPANSKNAKNGRWIQGPGEDFFNVITQELGPLPIIAEDLGEASKEAEPVRKIFEFPGLKILQFAFGENEDPMDYPKSCVVYTGTHDNDTTKGWFTMHSGQGRAQTEDEISAERKNVLEYFETDGSEIHWDMIDLALQTPANTTIIPLQDVMGLDSKARMNIPGTANGNWTWRFTWDMLSDKMITRLKHLTNKYNRTK
ncbi:MAG: 4-alpha-glucanotransferase [Candidatus Marinimicrobia bacterium]|nr:4-alpha-glucanotransferase [Candidatus Neomarinimicrobiota bacterium]